jgi:predicted kinase
MDSPRRLFIQMSGAPGSGKSTMASLLAKSLDSVIIDHDLLKSFLLDSEIPFTQSTKLAYSFQWVLAEDMIKQGRNVIIDSTCNFPNVRDKGMVLAQQYDYHYKYVECRVKLDDIDLLDQRLRSRVPLRSQRTGVNLPPADAGNAGLSETYHEAFQRWIENPCRPLGDYIVVDSTGRVSREECLEQILKQMEVLQPLLRK